MLDIHNYRMPGLPGGEHPLLPNNLVSGVLALARVQVEMHLGRREAAALALPVLQTLLRLLPESLETLRGTLELGTRRGSVHCWRTNPRCVRH